MKQQQHVLRSQSEKRMPGTGDDLPKTLLTGVIMMPGMSAEPRRTAVGLEKSAGLTLSLSADRIV